MALTAQQALGPAEQKYGVPASILFGVYGMETDFGANVTTSSAGAVGPFQFIPSTAKQYNYPLTNTPTDTQFQQQADAAAHLLSDLYKQYGDWNTALEHYSGGGYGLPQVNAKAQSKGLGPAGDLGGVIGAVVGAVNTAGNVASGVGNIADLVTSTQFWIRLGEAIAGILLLYLGLHALTGQSSSAGQQARHVTRIVPVPL